MNAKQDVTVIEMLTAINENLRRIANALETQSGPITVRPIEQHLHIGLPKEFTAGEVKQLVEHLEARVTEAFQMAR